MLAKSTSELFDMEVHELKNFKIKGYAKPIPILRVKEGWLYFIFDHLVFVPECNNTEYVLSNQEKQGEVLE